MDEPRRDAGDGMEELLGEAEQRFRQGVKALSEWGSQANEIIKKQPGVVLAGVALLGFVAGLLLRRAAVGDEPKAGIRPVDSEHFQ